MIMTGLFLFSCKNRDKQQLAILPAKQAHVDRDTIYVLADTINNKPVGKGFYLSKTGILYQLKRTAYGQDNDSVWSAILFLDSTLVTDDYYHRGQLKDFLDVPTYVTIPSTTFSKDKRFVYFSRATSDGAIRFLFINADPGSFEPLGGNWSRDRRNVYYESSIVEGAVRSGFRVFGVRSDSATDGKHIYVSGDRID